MTEFKYLGHFKRSLCLFGNTTCVLHLSGVLTSTPWCSDEIFSWEYGIRLRDYRLFTKTNAHSVTSLYNRVFSLQEAAKPILMRTPHVFDKRRKSDSGERLTSAHSLSLSGINSLLCDIGGERAFHYCSC